MIGFLSNQTMVIVAKGHAVALMISDVKVSSSIITR